MKVIKDGITKKELVSMAKEGFGDMVKAVLDTEQGIMAVGGEFHADEESFLMEEHGSKREHTWGINLHPDEDKEHWIAFDSMINLKPWMNNKTRGVESEETRKKIMEIVKKLVSE